MTHQDKSGRHSNAAPVEAVQALVLRDYWTSGDDEGRVRAGTIVDVTKDELITGMERGILRRYVNARP